MEEDGLFEQSHIEDEPFDALPPPLSPGQDQTDPFGDGENGEVSKLADVPEAKRKGVKRPQPKLDSNRLTSDRGLPALRTLFNDVRFKGKGHEAEDLRLLMKRMENWAHRLFPKLQFEDFIDKVERLGSKKEVQTCLKRIRLDMPLTHEDYTSKEGEEQEVPPEVQIFGDPDPFGGEHLNASPFPHQLHSTPAPSVAAAPPHTDDPSLTSPSPAPALPSLTEEQRRRMAENRLRALEKRRQKQQHTEFQSVDPQSSPPIPVDEAMDVSDSASPAAQVPEEAPTAAQVLEEAPTAALVPEQAPTSAQVPEEAPTAAQILEQAPTSAQVPEEAPSAAQVPEQAPTAAQVPEEAPSAAQVPEEALATAQILEEAPTVAQVLEEAVMEDIDPVKDQPPSSQSPTKQEKPQTSPSPEPEQSNQEKPQTSPSPGPEPEQKSSPKKPHTGPSPGPEPEEAVGAKDEEE